jgi:protease IV
MRRYAEICTVFYCLLAIFLLAGCAYVNVSLKDERRPLQEITISGEGRDKILIAEISGFISAEESREGFINGTAVPSLVSRIKEELVKAQKDRQVKAVILRINSPGGMVTASDMIYHELKIFRAQTGKPVIAALLDLGTSGAYYIAQAADRIIAHPTTVTGSIGVIMIRPNIEGLLGKIGIQTTEIKSGDMKAMGSPFRALSPEEQKIFQHVIDEMYERFLKVISENRPNLTPEKLKALADGRIYTAQQALDANLIDGIGYLPHTIELAKQMARLEKAKIIMYARPGDFKGSVYAGQMTDSVDLGGLGRTLLSSWGNLTSPRFLYLWLP